MVLEDLSPSRAPHSTKNPPFCVRAIFENVIPPHDLHVDNEERKMNLLSYDVYSLIVSLCFLAIFRRKRFRHGLHVNRNSSKTVALLVGTVPSS